jgi:hypothetical protein
MEVMPAHACVFVSAGPSRDAAEVANRLNRASSRLPTLWLRSQIDFLAFFQTSRRSYRAALCRRHALSARHSGEKHIECLLDPANEERAGFPASSRMLVSRALHFRVTAMAANFRTAPANPNVGSVGGR